MQEILFVSREGAFRAAPQCVIQVAGGCCCAAASRTVAGTTVNLNKPIFGVIKIRVVAVVGHVANRIVQVGWADQGLLGNNTGRGQSTIMPKVNTEVLTL